METLTGLNESEVTVGDKINSISHIFSLGFYPFSVAITLTADVILLVHLHRLQPACVPRPITGAIFILQLSTIMDLLNLIAPMTAWIHIFVPPSPFSCKVLQFLAREPYTIAEWCCAVFTAERSSQYIDRGYYRKYFSVVRLKLGFGLFALMLGAAYTNYMWMYGMHPGIRGSCTVLSEFEEAYYRYIVYTEPVVEFIIPQFLTATGLVLLIVCLTVIPRPPPTSTTSNNTRLWNDGLNICCFLLSLSNILLVGPKNVTRLISIVTEQTVLYNYVPLFYIIAVSRFPLRACLILMLLKMVSRKVRNESTSEITDHGTPV